MKTKQSLMKKNLASAFILCVGVLSLVGCSSTQPIVEPDMAPMESDYQLHKNWQVNFGAMPTRDARGLSFAEDDQHIYMAAESGDMVALLKDNQSRWVDQVVWQTQFDSAIVSGPRKHQDRLFIGTSKGQFIAVAASNGDYLWQSQLSSEVLSQAVIANNKIFTRTVDGKLYALNLQTGEKIWVVEHQMPSLSLRGAPEVIIADNKVIVAWETGVVQALALNSGQRIWETRIAVPSGRTDLQRMVDIQARLIYQNDRLYALGFHGKFVAIDLQSGEFYFVKDVSGYRDFLVDDQAVYVVDEADILYAFDRLNGSLIWKQSLFKDRLIGDLAESGDELLVVDGWGYLHWINKLQGTEVARVKHSNEYGDGNRILRVLSAGKRSYLFDDQGVVTSYKVALSNLKEFKLAHQDKSQQDKASQDSVKPKETPAQTDQETSWWQNFKGLWPF